MGSHSARHHILSLFFLVRPAPAGQGGNDGTSSPAVAGVYIHPAGDSCVPASPARPAGPRDGAPCSHRSPSTFINKLPLITAVIAELFHSGNYSSRPNPGYLGTALSPRMAASQLFYSSGLSLCCAVPKRSTPGRQLLAGGMLVGVQPQCGTLCVLGRVSHHR